ncbi:hypothetical protein RBU55_07405 [Pseudomonas chlororaphis subsp. aurantiaca]|uniref:hypothetical protein n=1 Tax=Pseudomonas chlororaphis TaxID=587753 RepID=UPI0027DEA348|nr:hypothetical protein [Pseudomonas chlororaphis]WMJ01370.1 hypothetical protein RBU55_07405 [Pseudomonas chlororaphis subsp. aurantiaca]
MTINYLNAHTQALGALQLVPIFLNSSGIVSRATLLGASTEAAQLLGSIPCRVLELADVFRCVNDVIQPGQTAYVTPTNSPETPYGAVVADKNGQVCAVATGRSKEGLAELIRFQLQPAPVGYGEASP